MNTSIPFSSIVALLPELSLLVLAVATLWYNQSLAPADRRKVGLLAAWGSFVILLFTIGLWFWPQYGGEMSVDRLIWGGMLQNDLMTFVFRIIFLIGLMLTSLITIDYKNLPGEFYAMAMLATIGFSLMAAAGDLIMLYVAIETASISLYVLAGFMNNDARSAEAGMKYFVYGAFASTMMLYGMSLLYGLTGMTNLHAIGDLLSTVTGFNLALLVAAIFVLVGFGFKISAFPFHFWTPDVYEGGPTPFTAFVSTSSKAAGFAVLIRVLTAGVLGEAKLDNWLSILILMCIITMTLGNFAAIYQTSIKRMLAYSSIAQAGYILVGVIASLYADTPDGSGAAIFYLFIYMLTNLAAFAVIILVINVTGSDDMKEFYGLSRRAPYLALVMLFALLSLAGIPPVAGFIGKFLLFKAAIDAGLWWLAMLGILNAFIALYYYLNVAKYMYLYRSENEETEAIIPVSRAYQMALAITLIALIYFGTVGAGPVFEWTSNAALAFFTGS